MSSIIKVHNLSKKYRLGEGGRKEDNLRELLVRGIKWPIRALTGRASAKTDDADSEVLWALRNLNFEVDAGETIGFIGSNGAGKSTLLKILSRITDPTEGEVRLRGKLASLLEVGTGFHPDLTGRENIYLNGTMLGMTRAEIRVKFDEIVAFAEMEKFLDTPVKRYSSGMYVRLGFAVAAHLDPEILVVDEVLAVGDMAFQKKCLGKMGDFGRIGRTVLFVSHNMAAIESLCRRGIVLQQGQVIYDGNAKDAVRHYIEKVSPHREDVGTSAVDLTNAIRPSDVEGGALQRIEVMNEDGTPFGGFLPIGGTLKIKLRFEIKKATEDFDPRINIADFYGRYLVSLRGSFEQKRTWGPLSGTQEFVCEIPRLLITPGEYRLEAGLAIENKWVDYIEDILRITVVESDFYGTGAVPRSGACVMEHHWRRA